MRFIFITQLILPPQVQSILLSPPSSPVKEPTDTSEVPQDIPKECSAKEMEDSPPLSSTPQNREFRVDCNSWHMDWKEQYYKQEALLGVRVINLSLGNVSVATYCLEDETVSACI